MNFRLTALFFGVVFLALVGLLVVVLTDDGKPDGVAADGLFAPLARQGVTEAAIDAVEVARTDPADEKLVFAKADGKWSLREPFAAKADQAAVEGLVRDLVRAKPVRYEELPNPAVAGTAPPTVRVTLKSGDQALTVNVGMTTIGGTSAKTFVTTSAAPERVLALNKADLAGLLRPAAADGDGAAWKLAKWLPDYRQRKLLGGDLRDAALEATAVKIAAGGKELALARTPSTGWTFTTPPNFGPADDAGEVAAQGGAAALTGVRPLVTLLTSLEVTGAEDYIEAPGDLAQYGLAPNDPAAVRIELTTPAGPEVVTVGKPATGPDGKPTTPAKVYAKLDGDAGVVRVPFDRLDALKATVANPGELRNKDLLPASLKDKLDAIDLAVGGQVVKFRKVPVPGEPAPQWVIYGGPTGPVAAQADEVNRLVDLLTRPRAGREVLAAPADAMFAGPETRSTIKAWAGAIDAKPDPKVQPGSYPAEPEVKAPPTAEVVLGRQEGPTVFARKTSGGRSTDFKTGDALLTLATKPRTDWIDPKFATFNRSKVNRLTFARGAETFDVEKADAGGWTFAQPPALKGKSADAAQVDSLLDQLAAIRADRVVTEQPTPDELKKYNLDPAAPRLRATVAVKDDVNKTRVYEFGTDTDDKKGVLMRQAGRPMVARVDRTLFDKFTSVDLRDPVVYRLDPAKVSKLKIRGWKGLIGPEPLTYQLEKKGAEWTATTPNTNPDTAKVNALIAAASVTKAEGFVGPVKPEYGTNVEAAPEAIELTLEQAGTPPVTLVIGSKADAVKSYATASALPGEVFLLNAATLRPYTERPAAFQK